MHKALEALRQAKTELSFIYHMAQNPQCINLSKYSISRIGAALNGYVIPALADLEKGEQHP